MRMYSVDKLIRWLEHTEHDKAIRKVKTVFNYREIQRITKIFYDGATSVATIYEDIMKFFAKHGFEINKDDEIGWVIR